MKDEALDKMGDYQTMSCCMLQLCQYLLSNTTDNTISTDLPNSQQSHHNEDRVPWVPVLLQQNKIIV